MTPELLYRYVSYNVRHEIPQQQPVIKGSLAGDNIILAEHPELVSVPKTKGLARSVDLSKWVIIHDVGTEGSTAATFILLGIKSCSKY